MYHCHYKIINTDVVFLTRILPLKISDLCNGYYAIAIILAIQLWYPSRIQRLFLYVYVCLVHLDRSYGRVTSVCMYDIWGGFLSYSVTCYMGEDVNKIDVWWIIKSWITKIWLTANYTTCWDHTGDIIGGKRFQYLDLDGSWTTIYMYDISLAPTCEPKFYIWKLKRFG